MEILKTISIILSILISLVIIWHLLTRKYINPYQINLYIAAIGNGKSSMLAKNTLKAKKRGEIVYTNCDDLNIDGVRIFNTYDLGKYYVHDAVIECDEISLFYDNRNFKNTSQRFVKWLRYIRHEKISANLYTQSYDCDKKIRTMCSNIYIGKKYFRVLTVWRKLRKEIAIKENALDSESQIVDELNFVPWFFPGAIKFTFIPRYTKYFDSFKSLDDYDGDLQYRTVSHSSDNSPVL